MGNFPLLWQLSDVSPQHIQKGFAMLIKVHGSRQAEVICAVRTKFTFFSPMTKGPTVEQAVRV